MLRLVRRRRTHASHLFVPGGELRFLFSREHTRDLGHHLRVRDFQLDLNPGARFCGRANGGFIESSAQRIAFTLVQRAQLLVKRSGALFKALRNFLNLRFLIVGQI